MYEKQNKHYVLNVFPERYVRNVIFRFLACHRPEVFYQFFSIAPAQDNAFSCLHGRKKLEEIRIRFSLSIFVLLRRHRKSS